MAVYGKSIFQQSFESAIVNSNKGAQHQKGVDAALGLNKPPPVAAKGLVTDLELLERMLLPEGGEDRVFTAGTLASALADRDKCATILRNLQDM